MVGLSRLAVGVVIEIDHKDATLCEPERAAQCSTITRCFISFTEKCAQTGFIQ